MKKFIKEVQRTTNWHRLPALTDWVIHEGLAIQRIPAPTFAEENRAIHVSRRFKFLGLTDITIDEQYNVYGVCRSNNANVPALLITAHIDTVFAADTDLTVRMEGDTIYGPGLGDNSMGVAGLLGMVKWLHDHNITPACDIWFVATSCEEGLGDLKGIRQVYERLQDHIGMVINLEGLAFGHVFHAGIAVHRLHITATTEGGHSWVHFGRQSATHGILQLGAYISAMTPPTVPRTTFNIGMIEGGQAINAIATQAGLWLDLRSESQEELDKMRDHVYKLIADLSTPDLSFQTKVVGNRPAGRINANHPLVHGALHALEVVGVRGDLETGSTDGNIPLAAGCPTVTIGITRGGNAHRLDEFIETPPVMDGMKQLILLAMATTHYLQTQYHQAAGD